MFIVLIAVGVGIILFPIMRVAHFTYIDQCSIPLWLAPRDVKEAVRASIREGSGEYVRMVNLDAFDYEHINILTNRRLLSLPNLHSGVDYEIDLDAIATAYIDQTDSRYLIIVSNECEEYKMFFVGSLEAFCDTLGKKHSKEN